MSRLLYRLAVLLVVVGLLPRAQSAAQPTASPEAPNILILLSDDQRADAVGAYGNPYLRTPHLDALVHEGFSFRQAYNMGAHHAAVCAPSRAMLMSGRQLYDVYDDLSGVPTFPELFREHGYTTFGTGKWHQSQAPFRRSFSEGENIFFGGMSDHFAVPVSDLQADGSFTEPTEQSFSSTLFADATVDFIERQAAADAASPFLAYVSFTTPHDPRTPPEEYLAEYAHGDLPLPPNFKPVHPFNTGQMTIRDEQLAPWPRTPEVVRAQLGEYYGLITHMDAQIGRILDALRRTGAWDNTIIVFTSDHGLAVGSHGLLGKQNLYEHSMKAPLVVTGPGIPHGTSDALVYLHDLFPTLADVAGLTSPADIDGKNLAPIWQGTRAGVRETLFTTYEDKVRAVRDGRWKLIRYPRIHHTQLFDLRHDPYELHNLADDPAQQVRVDSMMVLLETWQQRTGDPHPLTSDERLPMTFDFSTVERSPDRHQPASILRKYFSEQEEP